MLKRILVLLTLIGVLGLFNCGASAQPHSTNVSSVPLPLRIQEEDGTPSSRFRTLKVTNASLTDNADGSASLNVNSGDAPVGATYVVISLNGTLTAERVLTEGTNGIDIVDGGANGNVTLNFDSTEVGTTTWGSGTGFTWTFDAGATDPTIEFASGAVTLTSTTTTLSGDLTVLGNDIEGGSGAANLSLYANTADTNALIVNDINGGALSTEFNFGATDDHYLSGGTSGSLFVRFGTAGNVFTVANGGNVTVLATGSLAIPQGATPTVDAAGEIAQDTTGDQFLMGATPRVIYYEAIACGTIENLVAADDNILIHTARQNITVQAVSCRTAGFTTEPTLTFEDGTGNAMTGSPTCNSTETQAWTAITAGGAVGQNEAIRFDTTNTPAPTTATQANVCFAYTWDRR